MQRTPVENYKNAKLLKSGESFFNTLLLLIENAKNEIHLQTYIIENDFTGIRILTALKKAASRGVNVYLLIDAYGSQNLAEHIITELRNAGINIRKFSPATKSLKLFLGKRLHLKVVVVDYTHCIIGGINIADRYSGWDNEKPWLDYAVYFSGKACLRAQRLCAKLYFRQKANPLITIRRKLKRFLKPVMQTNLVVTYNDWYRQRFEISRSYRHALRNVQHDAIFLASYFLPSIRIMRLLKKAARRGVKISIVLPSATDVPLFNHTTKHLYQWLFKHKISVYEYIPGMLHAKCALMDNLFLTVGSFNMISLSEYGSVEMNVNVSNPVVIQQAKSEFNQLIQDQCRLITKKDFEGRSVFTKFLDMLSFHFVRAGMRLYLFFSTDNES